MTVAGLLTERKTYTLPVAARMLGVDYRTFHNWFKRGLIQASVRTVNGSGHTNLMDADDLARARLIVALRESGIETRRLERANLDDSAWHRVLRALNEVS